MKNHSQIAMTPGLWVTGGKGEQADYGLLFERGGVLMVSWTLFYQTTVATADLDVWFNKQSAQSHWAKLFLAKPLTEVEALDEAVHNFLRVK